MKPLSHKQQRFCNEYLLDMNATAAAIRAGYAPQSAYNQGSRLLALPQAQEYILQAQQKFASELDLFSHTLMRELKQLLHASSDDLIDSQGNLKRASEVPAHVRGALNLQTRESVVKGEVVTITTRKLFDRVNVLIKLCKQMGWLSHKDRARAANIVAEEDKPEIVDLGNGLFVEV
jgi:phage terminase small subunit